MQAGVVRLERGLHELCSGCFRADWEQDRCMAIKCPASMWESGECWARDDGSRREAKEELQTQFQQARCPGSWEDPLAWLMATKPPSIRDKEPILHLPAPPAGKSSSRSRKKRKKRLPWSINILYEK